MLRVKVTVMARALVAAACGSSVQAPDAVGEEEDYFCHSHRRWFVSSDVAPQGHRVGFVGRGEDESGGLPI